MKNMKTLILLLSVLFITSCATGEKWGQIEEGMTKKEVRRALGKHDQMKRQGDWTIYYYKNRLISGFSWDKTDYFVIFDPNGKVYEYGHGAVDTRTSQRMSKWSTDYRRNEIEQQKANAMDRQNQILNRKRSYSCTKDAFTNSATCNEQ
jgi:outer membrane protein assembly factor BamE (lipoprotein component of BamABCDE complex)